jgi:NitT/TauT family transport system substrate-binding protein
VQHSLVRSGFAACLSILLAGCMPRATTPALLPVRMAVGGQAQLIYLGASLAQELGFYTDEGVTVTLLDFPGGRMSLEALIGGSTDVVCGFYEHTIQMAAEGRDLRSFITMLRYPGLVAVSTGPGVARIEDLKGKIVGVSAMGSSTQMFLNYLLVKHGLKPEDVSATSIGMSASAVAAVVRHKVDAAIMTDPALSIANGKTPTLHILADTRTAEGVRAVFGADTYPSVVLYAKAQWLEQHGKEAQRLAHAVTRAIEWMRVHSAEEIRQRMPPDFRTEDMEADLDGLKTLQGMLSLDGKLTPESAETVRRVLSVSVDKIRNATIDLSKTYTNEFVVR